MNWSNRIVISCILVEMNSFQVGHRISSFPLSHVNFILFQLYYFYVAFTLARHVVQKVNIFFAATNFSKTFLILFSLPSLNKDASSFEKAFWSLTLRLKFNQYWKRNFMTLSERSYERLIPIKIKQKKLVQHSAFSLRSQFTCDDKADLYFLHEIKFVLAVPDYSPCTVTVSKTSRLEEALLDAIPLFVFPGCHFSTLLSVLSHICARSAVPVGEKQVHIKRFFNLNF